MQYVGLDVHAKESTFCVLDENGKKLRSRRVQGHWDKVLLELAMVKRPFGVCFEATTGYGYLYERLSLIAKRVVVAHPGQLRLIFRSKRKNDRVDAEKLAKLLFLDEVPPVYVPSVEVRSWREMIRHRHALVQERTRAKNAARALLRSQAIVSPKGLWTKHGLTWLRAVALATECDEMRRDMLIERIVSLNGMLKRAEMLLGRIAGGHPGVALLMTIPGVGIRTAEAVMAHIDDPGRFSRNKAIGSYFGLAPCQDASAGRNHLGHITRQGPALVRRLLTEAAWQGIRRSQRIRAYFERMQHGDPERKKIAVTATAHYLARVMHSMLRTGEVWRSSAA